MAELLLAASIFGPGIVHPGSLSRYLHLLGDLNRTEPLLMLLVIPVIFPLWQAKMSAVKKAMCNKPHTTQNPFYLLILFRILWSLYYIIFPKATYSTYPLATGPHDSGSGMTLTFII